MAAAMFHDHNAYCELFSTTIYLILTTRAFRPCSYGPSIPLAPTTLAQPVFSASASVTIICYQSKAKAMRLLLLAAVMTRMCQVWFLSPKRHFW